MNIPLRIVAEILDRQVDSQAMVTGWSIDSRTLQAGDLFFALRGQNHDGHAYIDEVFRKGAAAVVADRDRTDRDTRDEGIVLRVEDSLLALQKLAARARQRWGGEVVAVTGSAGKTTTKDIIAEMLSLQMLVAKNEGNLNNHIGLPLSLLRLDGAARIAVVELGMNHAGEIRALAGIAEPKIGVVTNIGYAHIENFDSIDGIAAAKRELVEMLPPEGTAVLNADDPRVLGLADASKGQTLLYGQSAHAQIRAEEVEHSLEGSRFRVGSTRFETRLTGAHNVSNVLAGIAVAGLYGISTEDLPDTVRRFQPLKMRGERFEHRGIVVFNDCYNSNPEAVRAMIDVLANTRAKRRIVVLGEMLELGHWAEPLHRDVGAYVAASGIDVLVGIRGAACYALDAAKLAGLADGAALFFEDPAEAGRTVRTIAQPGDAVLFKGSRGVHVERALEQFLATYREDDLGSQN